MFLNNFQPSLALYIFTRPFGTCTRQELKMSAPLVPKDKDLHTGGSWASTYISVSGQSEKA